MIKLLKKQNNGITLIALVITIIVLLILAGVSIATLTGDNGILTQASFAKFSTQMATLKEELELYKGYQKIVNTNFSESTLTAAENTLSYNTKEENESGNINDCLPSLAKSQYAKNIEIIKGKLVFVSQDTSLLNLAQKAGLEINPYLIVEGELLSSDINLLLMDDAGTLVIPDRVTKIGEGAFRGLEGLKTIIIPGSVKEIGNHAFSGNRTLENVIMETGIEKIGSFAFEDCSSLKQIQIPNSVKIIGDTCFSRCNSLKSIKIPGSVTTIPYRLVSSSINLEEIELEEGITKISVSAFEGTSISYLKLPSTINQIDSGAFSSMSKLTYVEIPSSNQTYQFQNGMLLSADGKRLYLALANLASIQIPETVTHIENASISSCTKVTSITIPKNVEVISSLFPSTVKEILVDSQNTKFKSINGNLYDYLAETLIKYNSNDSIVTLPNTLKVIKVQAFTGQTKVTDINLPESLEKIEGWAFMGSKITSIVIPKNVTTMGTDTFAGIEVDVQIVEENTKYKSVDNVFVLSKDGKTLYFTTKDLPTYYIPSSVEILSGSCFYSRSKLITIKIPENVKYLRTSIFDACPNLQKVEISSQVQSIEAAAFNRCNSLQEIIIDKKEGELSGSPWACPYGLRAVKWKQ